MQSLRHLLTAPFVFTSFNHIFNAPAKSAQVTLKPFSGQATFDDVDLFHSKQARRRIAYLSHLNALPEEMTVFNTLKYYADIEGGDVEHTLDLLKLSELRNKKFSSLS